DFFGGDLPDGPGVATLLPFFPRTDPNRVFGGPGGGGPADPDRRLETIELDPAFTVPVDDPVLGTPFALPTDGSSGTIDRATVVLVAGPGLTIAAPDADGDPSRESIVVDAAAGIDVSLDDAGTAGDAPAGTTLTVFVDGFPLEKLAVSFTAGGGGATTTTTS